LDDIELIDVALNGFPKSWKPLFKRLYARENSQNSIGFGMISFRKRPGRILKQKNREMKRRELAHFQ
jgi:hypothetical protein